MPKSVLFVCMGNIIRSPICEGLLRTMVDPSVKVDSAAIYDDDLNKRPEDNAIAIASHNGFDISNHISRLVCRNDFIDFEIIVTLDRTVHRSILKKRPPESKAAIVELWPGHDVDNPWHQSYGAFETMYHQIRKAMAEFIKKYMDRSDLKEQL